MIDYRLTLYWWDEGERTAGGEYPMLAADDAGALAVVMRDLDEQVALADQCEITTADGRVVWRNEWQIPGRRNHDRLAEDWKVMSRGPLVDLSHLLREAAADQKAYWHPGQLEQLLIEAALVIPECDWVFDREYDEFGSAYIDGQPIGFGHGRLPIGLFSRRFEADSRAMYGVREIRLVFFEGLDDREFRIDPEVAKDVLDWTLTVRDPVTFSALDLWYVLHRGRFFR